VINQKDKLTIPPVGWFLSSTRDEVVDYLAGACSKSGELWWYKESPVKSAVTLVAHVDTVHDKWSKWDEKRHYDKEKKCFVDVKTQPARNKKALFYDPKHRIFWSPDGLGADDRAGVFTILQIYNNSPGDAKPNLLFCDEEERGGAGAKAAVKDLVELADSLMFVELDRRGPNDCVFYNEEPKKFVDYIESFGFKKTFGSFSDVSIISRELCICGTNLSIGFEDEHLKHEHLYVNRMLATYKKTIKIVEDATKSGKKWELPKKKVVELATFADRGEYCQDWLDDFYGESYWESYLSRKGRAYYGKWARTRPLPKGGGNGRDITLFQELDGETALYVLRKAQSHGYSKEDLERNPYLTAWLRSAGFGKHGVGP